MITLVQFGIQLFNFKKKFTIFIKKQNKMAVGTYGSKKLADVTSDDVDVLYTFSPDRETIGSNQLNPLFNNVTDADFFKYLGADGVYRMRLPKDNFNQLGFYLVLVKPKSFQIEIVDCSFIVSQQDQDFQFSKKGIVIPKLQFQSAGSLVGYQVEYFDNNGVKVKNFHRIITSSDVVREAPATSVSSPAGTTYVLDSTGDKLFLTLTPDEVSLVSDEQSADLGRAGQKIIVSNTFFDPEVIEVEMVDHTIKTLSYGIFGNSTRDLETGLYSIFDEQGQLFRQYNLLTRKKRFERGEIDVKETRENINFNQNFDNLSQGI